MTCADYDSLVIHAGNRCQICETPAAETWRGKLVIDHEHEQGIWAVRGLLCPRCNTQLGRGATTERQAAYLALSWYQRHLSPLHTPEPRDGSHVSDGAGGVWRRRHDLWFPTRSYYRDPQSWDWLLRMFGPHRIHMHKAPIGGSL